MKIAEITCPVGLYTAASTSDRVVFHMLNRASGHRLHRRFVDSVTGKPVDKNDQVKGYETEAGDTIVLEQDEITAAVPDSDRTLSVSAFIRCDDIDDVYFDKPYYLAPVAEHAQEAFGLVRDGMRASKVAALAQTVLFRRVRTLLIRAQGRGLIATTLNFDYEVRSAREAFGDVPDNTIQAEMLELAEHIIKTKNGSFDPAKFDDRYEEALAELVKAKLAGRKIAPRKKPKRGEVVDLMAALRESAGIAKKSGPKKARTAKKDSGASSRKAS